MSETSTRECYCCTCFTVSERPFGATVVDQVIERWDHACRNHGAHGRRRCDQHGSPAERCDCVPDCGGANDFALHAKTWPTAAKAVPHGV